MIELQNDRLEISFPEVHKDARMSIEFQRTLRIPDDGKIYPLPPKFGKFPLKRVEDYKTKVPKKWLKTGGLFFPMYQREAMWISLDLDGDDQMAVKIAVGKICVVTGKPWKNELDKNEQDYCVVPDQNWIDGINGGNGYVKQFVAMPLGSGYSIEEQVTGKAEFGGIQILVYHKKKKKILKLTKLEKEYSGFRSANMHKKFGICAMPNSTPKEMGISSGGKTKQKIVKYEGSYDDWDQTTYTRVYIRIVDPRTYKSITGEDLPRSTMSAKTYSMCGFPWFDKYEENVEDVEKSTILSQVKSVKQIDKKKFAFQQQDDDTLEIKNVITTNPNEIKDGVW